VDKEVFSQILKLELCIKEFSHKYLTENCGLRSFLTKYSCMESEISEIYYGIQVVFVLSVKVANVERSFIIKSNKGLQEKLGWPNKARKSYCFGCDK
jgi:hypothetical protein